MLRPSIPLLASATAIAGFFVVATAPQSAHAGIEACGDIHVQAQARCEVLIEGGCEVQCEPVRMEAACAAHLYAECRGRCEASASVECAGSCEADCRGQCEVDPGSFDCRAVCEGDCFGSCDARCNDSQCRASCEASCSGACEGHCAAEPPSADCNGRCEASCEGSCEAQANLDCQIDCQADGFIDCRAELSGGCLAECREPEGALFCDGQYVDHGGNLEECIDSLRALFDIEVEGHAQAQCEGGRCEATASGSAGCQIDPNQHTAWRMLALCGAILLLTYSVSRGGPRQA